MNLKSIVIDGEKYNLSSENPVYRHKIYIAYAGYVMQVEFLSGDSAPYTSISNMASKLGCTSTSKLCVVLPAVGQFYGGSSAASGYVGGTAVLRSSSLYCHSSGTGYGTTYVRSDTFEDTVTPV